MLISASPASAHSPDHKLIAYAVDTKGSEFYTVNIIEAATGAASRFHHRRHQRRRWNGRHDSRELLYVWVDDEHRPRRVLRHAVGARYRRHADPRTARSGLFLGLGATQDRRFLLLSVHDHETAEISLIDAADPLGAATSRRAARARARLLGRSSRWAVDHPDQFRRRRGLSHRRGAGRNARPPSIGGRSSRTSPGG